MLPNFWKLPVVLTLLVAAGAAHAEDAPDCHLKRLASLDMRTDPHGGVSIPVKVQGHDLFFAVDTSATLSSLDPGLVDVLHRQSLKAPVAEKGFAGDTWDHYVKTTDFNIGQMHGDRLELWVQPRRLSADGMIAASILKNFDADFDFAAGKFNLFSSEHCAGDVVYWTNDPVAIVPMSLDDYGRSEVPVMIDGKKITAIVSTGSTTSIMSLRAAEHYLDIDEKSPDLKTQTTNLNGHVVTSYLYPFKALNFGGVTVSNPHIIILPDRDMTQKLMLGLGILRQLHVYLAYKEKKMYLSAASAH